MDLFLGFTPKGLIPMEIFVHPYIPMIFPISSQCGTLVIYPTIYIYIRIKNLQGKKIPNNHGGKKGSCINIGKKSKTKYMPRFSSNEVSSRKSEPIL